MEDKYRNWFALSITMFMLISFVIVTGLILNAPQELSGSEIEIGNPYNGESFVVSEGTSVNVANHPEVEMKATADRGIYARALPLIIAFVLFFFSWVIILYGLYYH